MTSPEIPSEEELRQRIDALPLVHESSVTTPTVRRFYDVLKSTDSKLPESIENQITKIIDETKVNLVQIDEDLMAINSLQLRGLVRLATITGAMQAVNDIGQALDEVQQMNRLLGVDKGTEDAT